MTSVGDRGPAAGRSQRWAAAPDAKGEGGDAGCWAPHAAGAPLAPARGGPPAAAGTACDRVSRAVRFIHDNFSRGDLSLRMVASTAFVSPYHFSRLFKAHTGSRFIDFLTGVRLARASVLLVETDHSVTRICHLVGYHDLGHFERRFKRLFGVSPSQYRKRGQRPAPRRPT